MVCKKRDLPWCNFYLISLTTRSVRCTQAPQPKTGKNQRHLVTGQHSYHKHDDCCRIHRCNQKWLFRWKHLSVQLDFHKLDEISNIVIRGFTVCCINKSIHQQNVSSSEDWTWVSVWCFLSELTLTLISSSSHVLLILTKSLKSKK